MNVRVPPTPQYMPPPVPRKGMPGWLVALVTTWCALVLLTALGVLAVTLAVTHSGKGITYDCSEYGRASCQPLTQGQVDMARAVWDAYDLENSLPVDPSRQYEILIHSISTEQPARAEDQYTVRHVDGMFYTFWVYYAPTATTS